MKKLAQWYAKAILHYHCSDVAVGICIQFWLYILLKNYTHVGWTLQALPDVHRPCIEKTFRKCWLMAKSKLHAMGSKTTVKVNARVAVGLRTLISSEIWGLSSSLLKWPGDKQSWQTLTDLASLANTKFYKTEPTFIIGTTVKTDYYTYSYCTDFISLRCVRWPYRRRKYGNFVPEESGNS